MITKFYDFIFEAKSNIEREIESLKVELYKIYPIEELVLNVSSNGPNVQFIIFQKLKMKPGKENQESKVIQHLCNFADVYKTDILLDSDIVFGTTKTKDFYKRFGFKSKGRQLFRKAS